MLMFVSQTNKLKSSVRLHLQVQQAVEGHLIENALATLLSDRCDATSYEELIVNVISSEHV